MSITIGQKPGNKVNAGTREDASLQQEILNIGLEFARFRMEFDINVAQSHWKRVKNGDTRLAYWAAEESIVEWLEK